LETIIIYIEVQYFYLCVFLCNHIKFLYILELKNQQCQENRTNTSWFNFTSR